MDIKEMTLEQLESLEDKIRAEKFLRKRKEMWGKVVQAIRNYEEECSDVFCMAENEEGGGIYSD